jgi:hypothetical protein
VAASEGGCSTIDDLCGRWEGEWRSGHRTKQQRAQRRSRRPASEALGWHGSAVTCAEGRRREVRRRPARRRTRQRGAAYRTEATVTSGQSCQNGSEADEASDRCCRGGRVRRGERSTSDSRSGRRLYTCVNGIGQCRPARPIGA